MTPDPNADRIAQLSDNYWDTIILVARGYTFDEIGELLGVNPRSVKNWSDRLRLMLNVERMEQVPWAYYKRTGHNPFTMKLKTTS